MDELKVKSGTLYIVPTPIGNLQDITLRALETLKAVSAIYCEDTRHSRKLMQHFAISTPLASYHEHNAAKQRPHMLERLAAGESLALISDAGTPLISDPGYKLVQEAAALGLTVTPLPGACAATTALSASGLPSDSFTFIGFLPVKTTARRSELAVLKSLPSTLIFYESPKRLAAMLADCVAVIGANRPACVAREMTKAYETFQRGSLSELTKFYGEAESIKGEIVVLIAPALQAAQHYDDAALEALMAELLPTHPLKQAAEIVALQSGRSKRDCYQIGLGLK